MLWLAVGLAILIVGDGVLTLVGGMLGIPTIINYTSLAGTPNYLQSIQVVATVLGFVLAFVGLI